MVKKIYSVLLIFLLIALTSCGGGGSNGPTEIVNSSNDEIIENEPSATDLLGQLIDSPLQGVRYETSSGIKGITNEKGEFKYAKGDTVRFFLGNIELPEIVCGSVISPLELFQTSDPNDNRVLNFIRLVQSIDDDGNISGSINISETFINKIINSNLRLSDLLKPKDEFENSDLLKDFMTSIGRPNGFIGKEEALQHFIEQIKNSTIIDSDKDGITNDKDTDDDNDGVKDIEDKFPLDAKESKDSDKDGLGDNADPDDDNDGVNDDMDKFPKDARESYDFDNDGLGDNADLDDDNDGVKDTVDLFPKDANESKDFDKDGLGDNIDPDDDNDGTLDDIDKFPKNANESKDFDGDKIGDNADLDDDNDGVVDSQDLFPNNTSESKDFDKDGLGDNADLDDDNDGINDDMDKFPKDASESKDFDNDGIGDKKDPDDDNDGINDDIDKFPKDASESKDFDNDGIGDNADPDDDNDSVNDDIDKFPKDASESKDFDNDGLGDNADLDDDNDGIADVVDKFPYDPNEWLDSDNDGVGDNKDKFPNDPNETKDFDNDGVGDNTDPDDDNDGVNDLIDKFPFDASESKDFDNDGVGDNTDPDDDNDGVNDTIDAFPFDSTKTGSSFSIAVNITDLKFDSARRKAYVTDKGAKKLLIINLDNGTIDKTFDFAYMPERMTISLDNNKLYVALLVQNHSSYWQEENQSGYIAIIDLNTLINTNTFLINTDPFDLVVNNNKLIVSSGSGQWTEIFAYDASNGTVLGKSTIRQMSRLSIDHINGFVFSIGTDSAEFKKYNINGAGISVINNPYNTGRLVGNVWVTPNLINLITRGGDLFFSSDLSLSRSITDTNVTIENLVFDKEDNAFFIINSNNELAYYNLTSLEIINKLTYISNLKFTILLGDALFAVSHVPALGEYEFIKMANPVFGLGDNTAPIADYTFTPANGNTSDIYQFDATNSSDAEDGSNLQYRWDINNDGIWETNFSTSKTFQYQYILSGTKIVKLQIKDSGGLTHSISKTITVAQGVDLGIDVTGSTPFELDIIFTDVVVDSARAKAYITEKYSHRMYVLNLSTGLTEKYFEFATMVERMAISPDGSRLYVALLAQEHSSYWWDEDQYGYISVFDLDQQAKINTFLTDRDPYDLVATNNKVIVSSGSGQWTDIYAYNATDGATLGFSSIRQASRLALHPSGNFVFAANTDSSPSDIEKFDISVVGISALGDSPYHGDHRMNGNVFTTPDGTHVITRGGDIYFASNMVFVQGLTPIGVMANDISFNSANQTVIVVGSNGYIYKYNLSTWAQIGVITNIVSPSFIIESGGKIYVSSYANGTTNLVEVVF